MPAAEVLAHRVTYHGEGAVWWPDDHLRLVDGHAGEVLDLQPDASVRRTQVGGYAAVLRPRTGGGTVVAVDRTVVLIDPDGTVHRRPDVLASDDLRMNDGACDPAGNFWVGSMAWDGREGAGSVFRFDGDGAVATEITDASVPNGLAWTPDGTRALWNDTPTQTVWQFDWAWDAGLTGRRPFARVEPEHGSPDGLTVDRLGGVWVACWGGRAVRRFDEHGRLDLVVDVAADQVSSCTIGGDQLDTLYVTTSREGLPDDADPLAGSVFVHPLGESLGLRPLPYAG